MSATTSPTRTLPSSRTPRCQTAVLSLFVGLEALKADLATVRQPALILHSTQDHIVPPSSVKLLTESLSGSHEVVELDRSFHVATIDYDEDIINERAVAFATHHATGPTASAANPPGGAAT